MWGRIPGVKGVRKAFYRIVAASLLGVLFCVAVPVSVWAQSSDSSSGSLGETFQKYAPDLIEQLSCKPYDLDCQSRTRAKYYQKMSEDNAKMKEREVKEEQYQKERAARERCKDRDDDRLWALCMKRYMGE